MNNRLTVPLLILAALLAGGAFFWMTGEERAGGRGVPAIPAAGTPAHSEPGAELGVPARPATDGSAMQPAPTRAERAEVEDAQGRGPRAARSASGPSLRGSVVDRLGNPVAGARITLARDPGFGLDLDLEEELPWLKRSRAETDAEGRFRFEDVVPGTHQIGVRAHGFAPYLQRGVTVLAEGNELDPLTLVRGAILSGVVVDESGRPVPEARIESREGNDPGLVFGSTREPLAVTAADGRFLVDELACGAWRLRVSSDDHPDLNVEGIAEEPGVEQGGLRWQLAPGGTIAGTVTGIPPEERDQLEVRARLSDPGAGLEALFGGRTAKVAENGTFLLRGLEVGQEYTLQARRERRENELDLWERSRSDSTRAKTGESGVLLAYRPEAALLFQVADAVTRAPIEAFKVESGVDWSLPLRDEDGRVRRFFPDGQVRAGGLRPDSDEDRVRLAVRAEGYREFERQDIVVRPGQELDLGTLFLDPVPTVRVHVVEQASGRPIEGARVRMQKDLGNTTTVKHTISIGGESDEPALEFGEGRTATTDESGWAVLTSFEGETVEILASAEGFATGRISGLSLPRGEKVQQELRLGPGGEVLVRVLDPHDQLVPGARVEVRSSGGNLMMGGGPSEITDSRGEALFENLSAGVQAFRLTEAGGAAGVFEGMDDVVIRTVGGDQGEDWTEARVVEGQRTELVLRAPARASLTGTVREAGKLLVGASLSLKSESKGAAHGPAMMMGGGGPQAKSDGEGQYVFADVKAGEYTLTIDHPTRRMPLEMPIEVREGDNEFDVDLPVSIVSGRVLDAEGKPLAGVEVWPERQQAAGQPRFRMLMIDSDGGGGMIDSSTGFGGRESTDADGRYVLRGVTPDVDLIVRASGDSVQPGRSEPFRVAPNQTRDGIDLRLDAAGSIVVEAHYPDGAPARMQLVQATFLEESDDPVEPKFGFLQQGSTELKGLRPGRWKVTVNDAQGGPMRGESGVEREVEVKPQEQVTAEFEVE